LAVSINSFARCRARCQRLWRLRLYTRAVAGYGLKAYLITQDIRQIVDAYGQNESIVSNCHIRIAFAPNQYETAELLSKMTGAKTVQKASYNFSGSRFSPVMGHVNASVDHIERPLMTPDEILRIRPPRKAGDGQSERIVEPGLMLIFVAGHFPILGTQMLYFADPVLAKRAVIAPPVKLFAIEDGRVGPQRRKGRTAREISRPEDAAPDESDLTPVERGILQELRRDDGI
jgi:type IV secretion system protein VirD4